MDADRHRSRCIAVAIDADRNRSGSVDVVADVDADRRDTEAGKIWGTSVPFTKK